MEDVELVGVLPAESGGDILVRALYDFSAGSEGLKFAAGDVMRVVSKLDDNWWAVCSTSASASGDTRGQGLAPANYLEVLDPAAAANAVGICFVCDAMDRYICISSHTFEHCL